MKSIFTKMFSGRSAEESEGSASAERSSPIGIRGFGEARQRAFSAVVASKLAAALGLDSAAQDMLLREAWHSESNLERDSASRQLLFLAGRMVAWIADNDDVYFRVKELDMQSSEYEAFLTVFEEVKEELAAMYRPKQKQAALNAAEEERIWEVYRDVMFAATQRKFLLIRKQEVGKYKEGRLLCEVAIKQRPDIPHARECAKKCLQEQQLSGTQVMSLLLVISEAVTNILKHAEAGKMTILLHDQRLYVVVEDQGPGFDLKQLPKMTLMTGYSTKKSLGQGFTLMLKMAEQVLLATDGEGSAIILVFAHKEENASGGLSYA